MKLLITLFLALMIPLLAMAESRLISPMDIDADELEILPKERRAIFTGNVKATQKNLELYCDNLTLLFAKDTLEKALAKGHVTFVQGDDIATANNGIYDLNKQTIVLTGNVKLVRGNNVLTGTYLIYDLVTEKLKLENKGGRVRARIVPKKGLK